MTTVTRVQMMVLVKYFSLILIGLSLLGAAVSLLAVGDVIISWPIFVVNLTASALLAWYLYKQQAHVVFSYDDRRFRLQTGRHVVESEWRQFSHVALVHRGGGEFVIHLLRDGQVSVELPVSALGLNPQDVRFMIMRYVRGKGERHTSEEE